MKFVVAVLFFKQERKTMFRVPWTLGEPLTRPHCSGLCRGFFGSHSEEDRRLPESLQAHAAPVGCGAARRFQKHFPRGCCFLSLIRTRFTNKYGPSFLVGVQKLSFVRRPDKAFFSVDKIRFQRGVHHLEQELIYFDKNPDRCLAWEST